MFDLNSLMFVGGVLLLIGIASSKFSARLGMPVLVLFLGVGMLAGSEGIGGIVFENFDLAVNIGSVALGIILFDGGLRTAWSSVKMTWKPALSLATVGVLVTAVVTGVAAMWILGLPLIYGALLGSIIGSTDAAAVFSVMRHSGVKIPERLAATAEIESASNDPMAIFLTIGLIELITGATDSIVSLLPMFVLQFGVGTLVGGGIGRVAAWAINRVNLSAAGLYPILAIAFSFLSFGLAAVLGGSGFLAIYITGIVIGNSDIVFKRGIFLFHDAAAWLSQIVLFVMLGLLSFPSQLLAVAVPGLLVSVILIFVARPVAVLLCAWPFKYSGRELGFLSWAGLKGAVPVTLATFPLMAGVEHAALIFNVVFFAVLVSAITQGWSLPSLARWLGLALPDDPEPPLTLEISALQHVEGQIVEYTVAPSARVAGQALRNLSLPDGALVALVVRGKEVIMPRGATQLRPGDHVFMAVRAPLIPIINRLFDPMAATDPLPEGLTLAFNEHTTLGQLHRFFGLPGPTWSEEPVGKLLEQAEGDRPGRLGPFQILPNDEPDYVTLVYWPRAEEGDGQAAPSADVSV